MVAWNRRSRPSRASFLARELAERSRTRLFAEHRRQVAEYEALLGPIDGRAADTDADRDIIVTDPGVGRQQNLRPLERARGMLAAARKRREVPR